MEPSNNYFIPRVIDKTRKGTEANDLYSHLFNRRIIFLNGEVNETSSNLIVAQLLYLNSKDKEKPVDMYIYSGGGHVYGCLSIVDAMRMVQCPIKTILVGGLAASAAAVIFSVGDERIISPNGRLMIHQVSGGTQGTLADMRVSIKEATNIQKNLYNILSEASGKSYSEIEKLCERDFFFNAQEAKDFGFADKIIDPIKAGYSALNKT